MNKKTHFGYKEVNESDKSKYVDEVFTSVAENYDVRTMLCRLACIDYGKRF